MKVRQQEKDQFAQDLANALGIDKSKVDAAIAKQRSRMQAHRQQKVDDLASALAKQLGLPESKVKAALESLPHPPGHP